MNSWKELGKTVLRVFAGTLLAAAVAAMLEKVNVFTLEWEIWQPFVAAATIAAATVVVNALNPSDTRYGLGSAESYPE